jgi:hypothetical protein
MKNVVKLFSMLTLVLGFTLAAHGQATRTWVSGVGDDVNPCSRTAPCKTFQGAISKTAAGGEISVLDPGGFGALTITKSLTIDGTGQVSSILSSGTNGITINAAATDKVYLRNIDINGAGTGLIGVRVLNAAEVMLENVQIYNTSLASGNNHGVSINTTNAIRVSLENVTIRNVGGSGVFATSTNAANHIKLLLNNTRIFDTGQSGIDLDLNADAVISRSQLTHNLVGAGLFIECAGCVAHVSNSVLSNNSQGVHAGINGAATVRLFGNIITQNTVAGIFNAGGGTVVASHQNNAIIGNVGSEVVTNIGQQ